MPVHAERRSVAFSAEQMFALVADIGRYPEFLPWCPDARIRTRQTIAGLPVLTADLVIAHGPVRTSFTSRVTLEEPVRISAVSDHKPFRQLRSHWLFTPAPGGADIEFFLSFEIRSLVMRQLVSAVFVQAARRMVSAFADRAAALYG